MTRNTLFCTRRCSFEKKAGATVMGPRVCVGVITNMGNISFCGYFQANNDLAIISQRGSWTIRIGLTV